MADLILSRIRGFLVAVFTMTLPDQVVEEDINEFKESDDTTAQQEAHVAAHVTCNVHKSCQQTKSTTPTLLMTRQ